MRVLVEREYPNTERHVRDSHRDGACTPSISPSCKCGDKGQCALSLSCPLRQSRFSRPLHFLTAETYLGTYSLRVRSFGGMEI